jgi:hypothetical protein
MVAVHADDRFPHLTSAHSTCPAAPYSQGLMLFHTDSQSLAI